METHRVDLTPEEHQRLNAQFPESAGSGLIGRRAAAIVRIFLHTLHPACQFHPPESGADAKVVVSPGEPPLLIEIKGTASPGLAWQQLKVSSAQSYRLIAEDGIPVYRVSEVFSQSPMIYVMKHGSDFILEPEARWTFKPVASTVRQAPSSAGQQPPAPVGPSGSKYEPLRRHLEGQDGDRLTLSFKQLVEILGFDLPGSAYRHRAFWANQGNATNRPWARAWQDAGYEIESVHQSATAGRVCFRRRIT